MNSNYLVLRAPIAALLALTSLFPSNAFAQLPGMVDASFKSANAADGSVRALAVQPDGKIIVGGEFSSYFGQPLFNIARLTRQGTLDNTFKTGSGTNAAVNAIARQPDGKIIIGGSFSNYNGATVSGLVRLFKNGERDTSFTPTFSVSAEVTTLTIQPDGKILVGGNFSTVNGVARQCFARLNADGTLDTDFISNPNGIVFAIALQPDGKIVIGGQFTTVGPSSAGKLARLNADGSLDTAFDTNLAVDAAGVVRTIALQPDGKVLIGGDFASYKGTPRKHIARILATGALDIGFTLAGSGLDGAISSLTLLLNGKILASGAFTNFAGQAARGLVLLTPTAALDTTMVAGDALGGSGAHSVVALQPDGKALIGGDFESYDLTPAKGVTRIHLDFGLVPANFQGIFLGTNPSTGLFGKLSLKLSKHGFFSGRVETGTDKIRFKGAMLSAAGGGVAIALGQQGQAYYISLMFQRMQPNTGVPYAMVAGGQIFSSDGRTGSLLITAPHYSKNRPASHVSGQYNIGLIDNSTEAARGYLIAKITESGKVRVAGKSEEGKPLLTSLEMPGVSDLLPLHFFLNKGKGFINGGVSIDATDIDPAAPRPVGAGLWCVNPPSPLYPLGNVGQLRVEGCLYTAKPTGEPPFGNPPEGTASLLSKDVLFEALLFIPPTGNARDSALNMETRNLTFKFIRKTGLFSASFKHDDIKGTAKVQGISYTPDLGIGAAVYSNLSGTRQRATFILSTEIK